MPNPNPERHGILVSPPLPVFYPLDATPLARYAVLVAEAELRRGVHETAPNRGKDVEEYQVGVYGDGAGYLVGEKWCARFVRYCYERGAKEHDLPKPFAGWRKGSAEKHDSDLASASKWRDCGDHLGKLVATSDGKFGDVGLFLDPNHVVLIIGRRTSQYITIEGNFRNQVAMVYREPAELAAIVRVSS